MTAEPNTTEPWLSLVVDASPALLAVVRGGIEAWLRNLRWRPEDIAPVVSAVSEAAGNAMEHAYRTEEPGTVTVDLAVERTSAGRRVCVEVSDRGSWRPAGSEPGRGNGIALMSALMAEVRVDARPEGTTVHLCSPWLHPG
ncbi:ATP-binding protein [Pseudonocardia oroxyli]|uniref:Serine/threonine-protein kinase RsbW n=1 Tax=Pseudonocardia oroxyli TaxID=366584 RepID=A0A1G7XPW8_PSEOR|nr:ATP-binding protein [Pseudonocardia oroxyli]SDG86259.1 serine/threonine-protein kinase RsbW [Pseudonocardia oroxyli]